MDKITSIEFGADVLKLMEKYANVDVNKFLIQELKLYFKEAEPVEVEIKGFIR